MQELPQVAAADAPVTRLPMRHRVLHLALNWGVFSLCYPLANFLAHRQQAGRSLALGIDAAIPFVPWMVLPYASSGLFFTLLFFAVRTPEQLRVASRRLLLATCIACLVFVVMPARFGPVRPAVDGAITALLFDWLALVDQPYNQFPSLHVAYCVVFWLTLAPLCRGVLRIALAGWLLLVGASTVFTWQHHLLDVGGGLLLGVLVARLVRPGATRRHGVTFYYAIAASLLALVGVGVFGSWLAAYGAACLLLVAASYRARRADFLRKHAGRHPWSAWLLFWPYLAGYRLTWLLVRWRERRKPAFTEHAPGLWIGRRLGRAEAMQLPPGCAVIDLCGELSEAAALRGPDYLYFPLLDLQAPRPAQLRQVLAAVAQAHGAGRPVFIHCAMGYSRSRLIARLYLRKLQSCRSRSIS
ncbi:phosphatase PAP2 family protein [Massilia sp. YIM B02443]|uniref:phosphatase PAP2 family protein n=1 Tax=Massilia sp. YIM B02443 TaxID=3050127 RepID=UPI0025B72A87|nr:phosphatase PAP2 family protein [Massilia sp. YIM B02443]MDN4040124.1 phosphatase PAP2 family protein [Massilia sp. YIM B02443]